MKRVDIGEATRYGIHLMSYLAGLAIVGYLAAAIGFWGFSEMNYMVSFLAVVVGSIVVLGGLLGLSYKVIADAVARGLLKAKG